MTVVSNYEYYIDANVSLIHVGISTNEILPNRQNFKVLGYYLIAIQEMNG